MFLNNYSSASKQPVKKH